VIHFITRRMLQTLAVIAVLSFVVFYLMSLMPGDPVDMMVASNPKITAEDVARLKSLYGLDQPIYTRYGHWMGALLEGDLGYSRTYRVPVQELVGPRLFNTFILSALSLIFSIAIAVPLGVFSALKPGSKVDTIVSLLSFGGISIPSFWLAIVLIILFAVKFPLFPAGGTQTIALNEVGIWAEILDRAKYLVLPVLSLSLQQIGRFSRFTRSSMAEAMRNDFIRTARAKGMSSRTVIWQHGFRNALIPLITILAVSISSLFSGALLTETVFAYQGVGKLVYDSIIGNDYNVAMIAFVISVASVLIMNLVADIAYGFADPRITYK
jgi:peptide/nickel transport system permease protein